LPGLETHTLNQDTAHELPAMLVTRAGAIAAGGAAQLYANQAPEISGAFLNVDGSNRDLIEASPAVTVLGDYLPSIKQAQIEFEKLHDSELVGDLMKRARLSKLTGCILSDLSPTHKGYTKTGIKAVKELGLGNTSRETHRVVHFARQAEETGELPTEEDKLMQVDHECRNPRCIYHTRLLDGDVNNELMYQARKIEPDIIAGKVTYIPDLLEKLTWLTFALAEEGDLPAKVISTRLGPYVLRLAHPEEMVVYGERVSCSVYDSLPSPGKKPVNRKSRAKPRVPKSIAGHEVLFTKTKYRKQHVTDIKKLYEAAIKAA
jgi:hypothetical protein